MAIDYNKWDKMVDIEGLQHDIEEAKENGGNFKEVPSGTYEVTITKLELGETGPKAKNPGMPMVQIWFKILNGEYKNSLIFFNRVLMGTTNDAFMIHSTNEFLKSLDSGIDVEFINFSQYAQMLLDIHESIDGNLEYALNYGENSKGYKTYEIEEVFEVE